jgi:DNA-binding PucR family transcriptional regulator
VQEERAPGSPDFTHWLRGVLELARAAGRDEPLQSLFDMVARTAAELTQADACAVQIVTEDASSLHIEGQVGLSKDYLTRVNADDLISLNPSSPFFESPSSRAWRSGSVAAVDEVDFDNQYTPWAEFASAALSGGRPYQSMLAVPMVAEGETTGVLAVYSAAVGVGSPELVALLQVLAEHAALAMTLARVRARERESVRRLLDANESLERQQAIIDQADDLHQSLMRAIMRRGDLGSIASTTAVGMRLEISLQDVVGTLLASSGGAATDQRLSAWIDDEKSLEERQTVATNRRAHFVGVGVVTGSGWVVPLVLADEVVAWLGAFGAGAAPDDLQRRLIERASMAITVELWRQQSAREVEWRLSGDLLHHILEEGATDPQNVSAHAAHLGISIDDAMTVMMFDVSPHQVGDDGGEAVRHAALTGLEQLWKASGIKVLSTWRDNVAVSLVPSSIAGSPDQIQQLARRFGQGLSRYLPKCRIIVVCSEPSDNLAELGQAYRTALGVGRLARESTQEPSGREVQVVNASDLGVYAVLLGASNTGDLRRLRDRILGTLRTYDDRKDGALVETLRRYFESGARAQSTADAMFVHPNTVAYRLKTIERLTGLDLHRLDHVLEAQLAIMLDDVLGR